MYSGTQMCAGTCVYTFVWSPEANLGYHSPGAILLIFFETGSLTSLEFAQ